MKIILFIILVFVSLFYQDIFCQEQQKDSLQKALPRLEIPEITIVGKKAITLPFARKGEIYDVNIFQAPPPDSSLMGHRAATLLPFGFIEHRKDELQPFNVSAECSFGSFVAYDLNGYLSYKKNQWGSSGKFGYYSSEGHTSNSSSKTGGIGLSTYYIFNTDNDFLNKLRASTEAEYKSESFGMYGIHDISVRRKRDNFNFNANLQSLRMKENNIGLSVTTKFWQVKDQSSVGDSQVSSVTPELKTSFATNISDFHLLTELFYTSSSLVYSYSTQSPSLMSFTLMLKWQLDQQWTINVGGFISSGSGIYGNDQVLIRPLATVVLKISPSKELSCWYKPRMLLSTFDDNIKRIPFLVREFELQPEKTPLSFGTTFLYDTKLMSVQAGVSYDNISNKSVILTDTGRIKLGYIEASNLALNIEGAFRPFKRINIKYSGILQKFNRKNSSNQLPMNPFIQLHTRAEYKLDIPLSIWSSVDFSSKRNVDLDGKRILRSFALLSAGVTYQVISKTLLLFEISNIFNSAYEQWENYPAIGRQFKIEAKINIL